MASGTRLLQTCFTRSSCLFLNSSHISSNVYQARFYAAVKKTAKPQPAEGGGGSSDKVSLDVVTDTQVLHDYVCGSNLVKENRQDIKVKEDSEYPDWLWELRTGKPPPLEEMDPNTKQYWRRLRTIAMKENNKIKKTQRF